MTRTNIDIHRHKPAPAATCATLLASALVFVTSPAARAAITCEFANGIVTITLLGPEDQAVIDRHTNDSIRVNSAPCSGATVTNTDLVRVRSSSGSNDSVTIDLGSGQFSPGLTPEESGIAEIEFDIRIGSGVSDTVSIAGSSADDSIVIGGSPPKINVNADGDADITVGTGVETLIIGGADGNDSVTGQGGLGTGAATTTGIQIDGGTGNDTMRGGGGADSFFEGAGPNGADTIAGGAGTDTADYSFRNNAISLSKDGVTNDGETGENDAIGSDVEVLVGGIGADTLRGGTGKDILFGMGSTDTLSGQAGNDRLRGGASADTLDGGSGSDTADYFDSTDAVTIDLSTRTLGGGHAGGDTIVGVASGSSTISTIEDVVGSGFDDVLTGDLQANRLVGSGGLDTIVGAGGKDTLVGSLGDDRLEGSGGDDVVHGNGGNDDLFGGAGDDRLFGDKGRDVIDGGPGRDACLGGAGRDRTKNC